MNNINKLHDAIHVNYQHLFGTRKSETRMQNPTGTRNDAFMQVPESRILDSYTLYSEEGEAECLKKKQEDPSEKSS
jgi:hypothetical protein